MRFLPIGLPQELFSIKRFLKNGLWLSLNLSLENGFFSTTKSLKLYFTHKKLFKGHLRRTAQGMVFSAQTFSLVYKRGKKVFSYD